MHNDESQIDRGFIGYTRILIVDHGTGVVNGERRHVVVVPQVLGVFLRAWDIKSVVTYSYGQMQLSGPPRPSGSMRPNTLPRVNSVLRRHYLSWSGEERCYHS